MEKGSRHKHKGGREVISQRQSVLIRGTSGTERGEVLSARCQGGWEALTRNFVAGPEMARDGPQTQYIAGAKESEGGYGHGGGVQKWGYTL